MRFRIALVAASVACLAFAGSALAEVKEIVVGAVYPMSGSTAQTGIDARNAIETAARLINETSDLDLPGIGLPHLGGAKIRFVFADHQGDPQKGRAEAERLITEEKAVALIGTYHSAVAAVVSQVAERYQLPFLAADSSSPSLSKRGLKWFFRTSAHDEMFSTAMFDFFKDLKEKDGIAVDAVALFHEDTIFGTDSSTLQKQLAGERGVKILADIRYRANSPSLTAEVQQLKASGASVLMPSSYTTDATLLVNTMAELGYRPEAVVAQAAGFAEQAFFEAVGSKAEGVISRGSFALDLAGKRPVIAKVNALYREKSGKDFNDNSARQFMGALVIADAIDRAGSTEPAAIQKALRATDIPGERTIMPWAGIRFDESGQNALATPVLLQYQGGQYRTIWPFALAGAKTVWPMPGAR
jgi:branched-chain amino acid transport system substrate-binding protein